MSSGCASRPSSSLTVLLAWLTPSGRPLRVYCRAAAPSWLRLLAGRHWDFRRHRGWGYRCWLSF
eukprot:8199537-Pyramimonas_sp.AAC.1